MGFHFFKAIPENLFVTQNAKNSKLCVGSVKRNVDF